MASTAPNTVLLEVNGGDAGDRRVHDAKAGGAITPGHFLTWSSGTLVAHAGAQAVSRKMVALEQPWSDSSPAIDDAYATNDRVLFIYAATGDLVNGILTSGQNVAAGAALAHSATGGQVIAWTGTALEGTLIGWAEAAADASSAAVRVKIRIS
jgi:hypothetical protein